MIPAHWLRALAFAALALLLAPAANAQAPAGAASAAAAPAPAAQAPRRGAPITLNFVNAEIESVARTMAVVTGKNVVLDARVKGTINLLSERPVSPAQAINQFAAALRLQGFALVESGNLYKVLPEADAKLQADVLPRGRVVMGNQIVTQVFALKHENANNLVQVLRPLISPNNTINASGAHTLLITDYADNLQRLGRIINGLDQPAVADTDIIALRYSVASDMAPLVQKLLEANAAAPGGAASPRASVLAEPRSNALIVRAPTAAQAQQARMLILKLDQPALIGNAGNGAAGNIWVVHLKNADAVKLAATLRAAMAANSASPAAGAAGAPQAAAAPNATAATSATSALQSSGMPSTGGQIQADPATNSLIITASEPEYRQLRAVIDKLDTRRAQVYVESLIAEVSADKAAELGVQWQSPYSNADGTRLGLMGTNFGAGSTGNILGMSAALATNNLPPAAQGLNLAGMTTFRGVPILGMLAHFLQSTGEANILSTPNLITLDNEEARIMIGQNVPFLTGQYTNTGASSSAVNPFQTIERKDVGLTLRVRPQIGQDGTVRMQIYQEVSTIRRDTASGPITNKRSIESSVVVDDSQVIVLGGLLSDEYQSAEEKVPLLGDIPLLGGLFRHTVRSRKKTNLMVFLRPVVMREARDSADISTDRYDLMRAAQIAAQPPAGVVAPLQAPVLPPLPRSDMDSAWSPVSRPRPTVPAPLSYPQSAPVRARPGAAAAPWADEQPAPVISQGVPAVRSSGATLTSGDGLAWNSAPAQPQPWPESPLPQWGTTARTLARQR